MGYFALLFGTVDKQLGCSTTSLLWFIVYSRGPIFFQ